jgi:hypothetical protein
VELHNVGLSISAAVLITIILIIAFWKPVVDILKRLRLKILQYKDLVMYFETAQESYIKSVDVDLTYDKSLTGPQPPDSPDQIIPAIIANIKKSMKDNNIKSKEAANQYLFTQYAIRSLQAIYLSIYTIIFGSQIMILQQLTTNKEFTRDDIKVFYDDTRTRYPDLYKKITLTAYIDFLLRSHLIIHNNGVYRLTGLGKGFLAYIERNYLPPRPF